MENELQQDQSGNRENKQVFQERGGTGMLVVGELVTGGRIGKVFL